MNTKDPYGLFNIKQDASEKEISEAFHKMLRVVGGDNEEVITAYNTIRTDGNRSLYRYLDISSYICNPPQKDENCPTMSYDNLEMLARELAFLNEWELVAEI